MGSSRGKQAVRRALRGRIPHLTTTGEGSSDDFESELDLLAEYLYHITVARSTP